MDKREKEKVNWRYYTTDEYVKSNFLNKDFDTIETNYEVILMDYLLFYFIWISFHYLILGHPVEKG